MAMTSLSQLFYHSCSPRPLPEDESKEFQQKKEMSLCIIFLHLSSLTYCGGRKY